MRVVSGRDTNDRVKHCIAKRRFRDGDRVCLERQVARYPSDFFVDCIASRYIQPVLP
jgi:hypothetical protein